MNKTNFDLYLVSGNITLFIDPDSDNLKSDLLYSSLYSHSLARSTSKTQTQYWKNYTNLLSKLAWENDSKNTDIRSFTSGNFPSMVSQCAKDYIVSSELTTLSNAFKCLSQCKIVEIFIKRLQENIDSSTNPLEETTTTEEEKFTDTSTIMTIVSANQSIVTLQIFFRIEDKVGIDIFDHSVLKPQTAHDSSFNIMASRLTYTSYSPFRETIAEKVRHKVETEIFQVNESMPDCKT